MNESQTGHVLNKISRLTFNIVLDRFKKENAKKVTYYKHLIYPFIHGI